MTKLKLMIRLTLFSNILLVISCVKAPIELTLKEEIAVTEAEIKEITDKTYEILAELNFEHPAGSAAGLVNPKECSAAYKIWLRKRFDIGLVPKRVIPSSEYGESSSNPKITQCRPINLEQEFVVATEKSVGETEREASLFTMNQYREALKGSKCAENFIDPDRRQIEITEMNLHVIENTLTVSAPRYVIYTSDEELNPEMLSEVDAEKTLIDDGTLMPLAETRTIPSRFVGNLLIDPIGDEKEHDYAVVPLVSLEGSTIAIPKGFSTSPEITEVAGSPYYIVPQGGIRMRMSIKLTFKASLADAICVFKQFKNEVKEEDDKRKKAYDSQ